MSERRSRRIGSDEAHAWARNLRLGNPIAKLVLSMVSLYVNGDGVCWVGLNALADDCELAVNTVRARLAWLETVGVIARMPQWVDGAGVRNSEARGKRTSDEIRLLFGADPDEIEARARGHLGQAVDNPDNVGPVSLAPDGGPMAISPPVALQQPSNCVEGLDSLEPEPDSPPYPPHGGDAKALPEDLKEFLQRYPAPITDIARTEVIWKGLTGIERVEALQGCKGYAAYIEAERRAGRNRSVKDAHSWLRNRQWGGYLIEGRKAESAEQRFNAAEDSPEWHAWQIYYRCCGQHGIPPFLITGEDGHRVANVPRREPPVGMGMNSFAVGWVEVEEGTQQFAAWLRRLRELPGQSVVLKAGANGKSCLRVTGEWPPSKKGIKDAGDQADRD